MKSLGYYTFPRTRHSRLAPYLMLCAATWIGVFLVIGVSSIAKKNYQARSASALLSGTAVEKPARAWIEVIPGTVLGVVLVGLLVGGIVVYARQPNRTMIILFLAQSLFAFMVGLLSIAINSFEAFN